MCAVTEKGKSSSIKFEIEIKVAKNAIKTNQVVMDFKLGRV